MMTSNEFEEQLRKVLHQLRDSRAEVNRLIMAELDADAKKRMELRTLRASLALDVDTFPAQIERIERQRLEALLSELQKEEEQLVEKRDSTDDELYRLAEREREAERTLAEVKHERIVTKQDRERARVDVMHGLDDIRATSALLTSRPAELRKLAEEDVNKAIEDCAFAGQ